MSNGGDITIGEVHRDMISFQKVMECRFKSVEANQAKGFDKMFSKQDITNSRLNGHDKEITGNNAQIKNILKNYLSKKAFYKGTSDNKGKFLYMIAGGFITGCIGFLVFLLQNSLIGGT